MIDTSSTQYFFGGWAVVLLTIWIMAKFEGTRSLLYYLFWLGIVLDVVSHSEEIYLLYSTIFNLSGQATPIIDITSGIPVGGGPPTIEQNPTNTPVRNQPGNGNNPVKTMPGVGNNPTINVNSSTPSIIDTLFAI